MRLGSRFFLPIGTMRHAGRLGFLSQDVRSAGTVLGFFAAAAALGARPEELALMVCRRHSPDDLHRQIVLVFQRDPGLADALAKLYRARGRPIGFEAEQRWCAIPEPAFLADETFALLAAKYPTLLLIEESDPPGGPMRIEVLASGGFNSHPKLNIAPLQAARAAPKAAPRKPATVMPMPARKPAPPRPAVAAAPRPAARNAQVVPLRPRRLKSTVALNERVERQVVNEFRRLLRTVALYS